MSKRKKFVSLLSWKKEKTSASSEPSRSQSALPTTTAHPPSVPISLGTASASQSTPEIDNVTNSALAPEESKRAFTLAILPATSTTTPAISGVDHNSPGISRIDAWLGRAILFLTVTKNVAEATDILAPLKAACGATVALLEEVQAVRGNSEAWNELVSSIERHRAMVVRNLERNGIDVLALEADHSLKAAIGEYHTAIIEVLASIFKQSGATEAEINENKVNLKQLAKRIGTAKLEANVILGYRDRLTEAKEGIMLSFNAYLVKSMLHLQENEILKELQINGLEARSHVEECMENTRQNVLSDFRQWSENMGSSNILWIKGHPGVGKSAIATSLVKQLRTSTRLGSHFFFQRQKATEMTPNALWRTIAYDLAQTYPAVRWCLVAKLKAKQIDLTTLNTEDLFLNLIHEPLMEIYDIQPERSPIIVIDALDECGGLAGQRSDHRKRLLRTLEMWHDLPSKFKLVVTSRVENDIGRLFGRINPCLIDIPAGEEVDALSSNDILVFLEGQFKMIQEDYEELPSGWPESHKIQLLADRAGGLFIWAKTVVSFIGEETPKRRLGQVLSGRGIGNVGTLNGTEIANMGTLYSQILDVLCHRSSEEKLRVFHSLVGTVILSDTSLTVSTLAQLLSIDEEMITQVCRGLQSVMEYKGILRFYHQSFVDFLLDSVGCPPNYQVDLKQANAELSLRCLTTMTTQLKFNICELESSYLSNDEVQNLKERVRQKISDALQYSCIHWSNYLRSYWHDPPKPKPGEEEPTARNISSQLDGFFTGERLLYWLEILSVMGKISVGISAFGQIKACINNLREQHRHMVMEVLRFMLTFYTPISTSIPHIYVSALPFTPMESTLWQNASESFPNLLKVCKGRMQFWPTPPSQWRGHTDSVKSVAYSPDGRHIVSGSDDETLRIWDAETGVVVGEPLMGHTYEVTSVAYSPDGRHIVSGSDDNTLRIWDAETGVVVGEPLVGHTGWVRSVAYSPDGRHIVSGSDDETLRIWDAETGVVVGEPLMGHTNWVSSVAYSPDGRHIVSGSGDKTLRIWDAETGLVVGEPLMGHTDWVSSVAYSPDGRHIVSGSGDKTLRIWDAETGLVVGEPLMGHTHWVSSVAYSPDGRHIVSGSGDKTLRIWDAETGVVVGEPLMGHTDWVRSVAYSPDGRHIVSGSDDNTLRIWDAETGLVVGEPLVGHTGWVRSVAYSPDGRHIVSGSGDKTLRIWDAETGVVVGEPLMGHTHWVSSVAYSPDGRHIVSGSGDKTLRIWDAETGLVVGEPLMGHTDWVSSVAYSPDGRHIVSGSGDDTLRIWDAETGVVVGEPLMGHTAWVNSVAYSPDGRHIVSGSYDKTLRIWDAEAGVVVGEPLMGHTDWVSSVAYSPDGRYIVSGSGDKTLRIWDAETGVVVGEPLMGHTRPVSSVAYSPDGRHIVSGSGDETLRIWDAETGVVVGEPLMGHTAWVNSVAYSPDGRHIVSGSYDKTLRIWDAEAGVVVGEPLMGHTDWVSSVAYSPDGRYIVSGSGDKTLRIWDAETGVVVGEPLMGHTRPVSSVAYSPDGRHIVSGSGDETLRIWDAETGVVVGEPLMGHTYGVRSVAYSPDGRHIVSSSYDKTLRTWDADIGLEDGCRNIEFGSSNQPTPGWHVGNPTPTSPPPMTALSGRALPPDMLDLHEGWVRDAHGLLFWVPEDCRNSLTSPAVGIFPTTVRQRCVRLDFTRFRYGPSWDVAIKGAG